MNELRKDIQSFWPILLKSLVTLGIYWWVYLFRTIRRIESACSFDDKEIKPSEVRNLLIGYLIVAILLVIINIGSSLLPSSAGQFIFAYMACSFIADIVYLGFTIAFWDTFLSMIKACQKKRAGLSLDKRPFWVLVLLMTAGYSSPYYPTMLAIERSAGICLGGLIFLFLMYYLVTQINKIWMSDQVGVSDTVKAVESDTNAYRKRRPPIVTLVSWIFIIWGIESSLLMVSLYTGGADLVDFADFVVFAADIVLIVCGIGMLKGANWARLLYLCADPALYLFLVFYFVSTGGRPLDVLAGITLAHVTISWSEFGFSGRVFSFVEYPWCSIFYIISVIILVRSNVAAFFKQRASRLVGP